jgi:hypothetical protein
MAIIQPSQLATGSYSLSGSFSGSFQGNGAGLNNIPSSAIVGLSSTQIASGNVTASVSTGTGSFTVTSGSSTFMFVSSSGNVGFGTSSPSTKLVLQQDGGSFIRLVRNLSTTEFGMFITNVRNGVGNAGGVFTANNFEFRDSVGTSAYLTINGGNVLINTTTDAGYKLDVNGTARMGNTSFSNSSINIVDSGQIYSNGTIALQCFQGVGNNRSVLVNINPNTTSITDAAILAANSTTKGFLPPRTTLISNISSSIQGLMTYVNSGSNEGLYYYNSGSAVGWHKVLTNSGSQEISGSLNVNNTLYVTGSKVGVGTSNFVGSIKLAVNGLIGGPTFSSTYLDLTGGTPELRGNSGIGYYVQSGNHIFYGASSTERMRIIGSTGHVSIGTTNSFDRLQNNGGMCFGAFNNATINYGMGEGNHTYLQFATNGIDVMRISPTQNVLIGTTTDAGFKLDVNGNSRINGTLTTTSDLSVSGNYVRAGFVTTGGVGRESNWNIGFTNANNGGVSIIQPNFPTQAPNGNVNGLSISYRFGGATSTFTNNSILIDNIINQTSGTGITRGIYINPTISASADWRAIETTTGSVLFNGGNVGIGTSTFWGATQTLIVGSVSDGRLGVTNTQKQGVYLGQVSNNPQIFGYDYLSLQPQRLCLNSFGGNVLIGTTTDAGYKLDVNGTARVSGNTTIVGTSLSSFSVSNGATTMIQTATSGIAGSDFRFRLFTNNQAQTLDLYGSGDYDHQNRHAFRIGNTEWMRLFNTGNFVIGTTTDTGHKLLVSGSGASGSVNLDNTLYVSGSRVGIGMSNPLFNLDVVGQSRMRFAGLCLRIESTTSNGNAYIDFKDSASTLGAIGYQDTSQNFQIINQKVANLILGTSNGERMRVASTGNVLINTTTDAGFKLDVNGTARVKGTGATSATTAFTVQNSGGTTLMSVRDDSRIIMPVGGGGNVSIGSLNANTNAIDLRGYFANGTNCGIYIENFNAGTIKTQLGSQTNGVYVDLTQTFSNGGRGGIGMIVTGIVNNTGTSVGDIAGYSFAPTITSLTGGSVLYAFNSTVGGAYINTSSRQASSILQADSTTQGFLPPRMTTTQKNAIATPAEGLMVYDTVLKRPCFYDGTSWVTL